MWPSSKYFNHFMMERGGKAKSEQVTGQTKVLCIEFLTQTLFS